MHYLYILHSPSLDRYYAGETADPQTRVRFHNAGKQRYTRRAGDWALVFVKAFPNRHAALEAERQIKRAKSQKTIKRWINNDDNIVHQFG